MKSNLFRLASRLSLVLLLLTTPTGARPQDTAPEEAISSAGPLDAASFATELHRFQSVIEKHQSTPQEIAQVRKSLPAHWDVKTSDGSYQISSKPLASLLEKAEQNAAQKSSLIENANQWLASQARQAESYAAGESAGDSGARAALSQILARREFAGLRTRTARDAFRDRIDDALFSIVEWILSHIGRHATSAKIFFEILLFAAVVCLGAMLVRFWTRRARIDELQAPQSAPIAQSWQEWIRAARAAAERGDFREAVHSTYWAGISYLESAELIVPDRTRTPREYVRLLSRTRADTAVSLEASRAALAALTSRLEQVWYGRRPASREDFVESMRQIEGLGCQLR